MKLREIENYGFKILQEKAKDGSMTVYAKFSEADKRNQNSRIYPLKILSREVDRLQTKIAAGQFLGQADHSDSPQTFLRDVSHVVTGLEMKGNNGYATIKILNTEAGRNIQEIIKGKGKVGISTRSVGTVDAKTGKIQSDLKLLALDLVANPSVKDATIGKENILEGLDFEEDEKLLGLSSKDVEQMMEDVYHIYLTEEGFRGDFEDFKKEHGNAVLAVMLVDEGKFKNAEEALKHLSKFEKSEKIVVEEVTDEQVSKRIYGYYQEAVQGGFIGTLNEWKEKFPKIVETAGESIKITEKKAEPKEKFKAKITWEEAVSAGFKGTIAEYREKYPDIELILPAPRQSQKPIAENETLEEQTKRVFETLKASDPDTCITLEEIRGVLRPEYESKQEKKIRELAIRRVNASIAGSGGGHSQAQLEKFVEEEIVVIKEEKTERKRKNWEAYRRLLD